ncbi:branched-chain amino acid transport system ATP-binding protein [Halorubrum aquaticum]|uniref:Probable branched-chain amino acid transport ATP-binding protein LivG n=1 Tax=Halorubrum aquaticum TaxID=387340 RepID=A0A1I3A0M7_9EURY|nr:ABC transporter ATP-binding protein [Halorubrum aquaticum]SFH43657.1 branched-chain amino acid transport system ATP-binding protein [Halorubrum aquaticum]
MSDPLLRTDSVTKRFGKLTAVSDVSLSIPEGGISSIIGPNGAGKTTLFNLFTGKHAPTEGSIEFRGEEIGGLSPHEIVSRGIVRSYQITNFFSELSALENVRLATQADRTGFGPDDFLRHHASLSDAADEAEAVLDRVGLLDVADQTAANLAYGQRRHLEIGIALATDPDLLLMDEPTAGMGPEQTNATVSLIEDIAEDATVVLIEHDMDIVMNISERIAVMNKGELIARGTPAEISENEAVQRAYLGGE